MKLHFNRGAEGGLIGTAPLFVADAMPPHNTSGVQNFKQWAGIFPKTKDVVDICGRLEDS